MDVSEKSEEIIEKRKNKIKETVLDWLKDNHNKALAGVLIFAIAIRLYYFLMTMNQPLWWDEAVYGSLARSLIPHTWDNTSLIIGETLIRPIFFPILWAFLLKFGANEAIVRFFLEFIPSALSVFFIYLIGKEIFNRKTGIISAFIFSTLWIHLFYTSRLLTNIPALLFLFSSVYYFILATKSKFHYKYFTISLFLLSLSTLTRYPSGIIFSVYLTILIIGKNLYIKKLRYWYSTLVGISPLLIFFTYNYFKFENIFPAFLGGNYVSTSSNLTNPIAFHLLNFIPIYLKSIFFICFLVGLIIILFEIFAGYNLIHKNLHLRNYLFVLLILVFIYSFFVFYMRTGEDRWLLASSLPLCLMAGFGINFLQKHIKKHSLMASIFAVILILFFGAYAQLNHTDDLIKSKQETYLQFKQGLEWANTNTLQDAAFAGIAIDPYLTYYAEREFLILPQNDSDLTNLTEADYLVLHAFNEQPAYINQFLQENQDKWQPVNVAFFDKEQKQPGLIIYKNLDK